MIRCDQTVPDVGAMIRDAPAARVEVAGVEGDPGLIGPHQADPVAVVPVVDVPVRIVLAQPVVTAPIVAAEAVNRGMFDPGNPARPATKRQTVQFFQLFRPILPRTS
jgi:hypothetical protein